ncbi:MAG: methyltransferase domain-containing protein [Acidimicrobiia bacterium]
MDRATVEIYEAQWAEYEARRPARHHARAVDFAAAVLPGMPCADLGCGPGVYLEAVGANGPVAGLDAAWAMVDRARHRVPEAVVVQGDLEALPFRDRSLGGAWARNTYVHVAKVRLPAALAHLHRALAVGAPLEVTALVGDDEGSLADDEFGGPGDTPNSGGRARHPGPGRFFARWPPERFAEVVAGAGFDVERTEVVGDAAWVRARRARTLPDFVGPGMRLLVCGLNPSLVAADAGYGYAGATNRFWPAAVAAGVVSRARDPLHVLAVDRVGMTDLVKRATPRADVLSASEYAAGAERVRCLVEWLRPGAVVFVGLAGWRGAVDRRARPGVQPAGFAGVPAYVMPSTSGLNARTPPADLVDHFRAAACLADRIST